MVQCYVAAVLFSVNKAVYRRDFVAAILYLYVKRALDSSLPLVCDRFCSSAHLSGVTRDSVEIETNVNTPPYKHPNTHYACVPYRARQAAEEGLR